jgi:D-glycero-D-manno-heptose 1,7-bisphosphate phosphatase
MTPLHRAIFLDRDGVINVNRPDHIKAWDEFVFLPRALEALRRLAASEFVIVVTTNQSVIARGLASEATVQEIHARMIEAIVRAGGRIDAVYYCPHRPDDQCDCRKPKPGMYHRAARELGIALTRSIVIGDAFADVAAAHAIGARPILVLTGRGQAQHDEMVRNNHSGYIVVDDLMGAVDWIAREEKIAL